jgi:glycosyltransferase involved in cell wall biosynthesis
MTQVIGIDASRAFIKDRTGIEEYSYQVIKHLIKEIENNQVVLYLRKDQKINFTLPENWKTKVISFPYLWTQVGLSLEMLFHPINALFVSAHAVPAVHPARNASLFSLSIFIQKLFKTLGISTYYNQHSDAGGPKNTVAVIHGLEYEFCPQAYSFWERLYMRWSIKFSCRWASSIIAVSNNTKKDLMNLYEVPEEKIEVIYEGCNNNFQFPISNFQSNPNFQNSNFKIDSKFKIQNSKFLLFIGRLEERKNIVNIINAFEILKEQYRIPHKLVLAGKPGFGFDKIQDKLQETNYKKQIILTGFVDEQEKWNLLKNAEVFVFPTLYEGFGLPILEAQNAGVPVVAANNSSIPEVVNNCHSGLDPESSQINITDSLDSRFHGNDNNCNSALLVNPNNAEAIADAVYKLISDENFRNEIIKKGHVNVQRFSWEKCADSIAKILKK